MSSQEPVSTTGNPCQVCGTVDADKPQCFRGENFCSEIHRKILAGTIAWPTETDAPRKDIRPTRNF